MPTPLRGRKGIVQLIWVAMLGEVLCKDVAEGWFFRKTSASGGAQKLGQFCALGCSPNLVSLAP